MSLTGAASGVFVGLPVSLGSVCLPTPVALRNFRVVLTSSGIVEKMVGGLASLALFVTGQLVRRQLVERGWPHLQDVRGVSGKGSLGVTMHWVLNSALVSSKGSSSSDFGSFCVGLTGKSGLTGEVSAQSCIINSLLFAVSHVNVTRLP